MVDDHCFGIRRYPELMFQIFAFQRQVYSLEKLLAFAEGEFFELAKIVARIGELENELRSLGCAGREIVITYSGFNYNVLEKFRHHRQIFALPRKNRLFHAQLHDPVQFRRNYDGVNEMVK